MNVFCYPGVFRNGRLSSMLDSEPFAIPNFGFRACVPLANGKFDRTEVDMRLGDLLVEAKLTESDFQSAPKALVRAYRDFAELFDEEGLPQTGQRYQFIPADTKYPGRTCVQSRILFANRCEKAGDDRSLLQHCEVCALDRPWNRLQGINVARVDASIAARAAKILV
jgi:hypothetical protein